MSSTSTSTTAEAISTVPVRTKVYFEVGEIEGFTISFVNSNKVSHFSGDPVVLNGSPEAIAVDNITVSRSQDNNTIQVEYSKIKEEAGKMMPNITRLVEKHYPYQNVLSFTIYKKIIDKESGEEKQKLLEERRIK